MYTKSIIAILLVLAMSGIVMAAPPDGVPAGNDAVPDHVTLPTVPAGPPDGVPGVPAEVELPPQANVPEDVPVGPPQ